MHEYLKNTYKSKVREFFPNDELYLAYIDNFTELTDTLTKRIDKRFIQFYFCTKGSMTFNFNNGTYKINLTDGFSFLIYNPSVKLPLNLSINSESKVCLILVSVEKLHELFSDHNVRAEFLNSTKSQTKYYKQLPVSSSLRMVLNQIENQNLSAHFENLYVLGKIYEILTIYFSESEMNDSINCPFLDNEKDAKKLKEAREILLDKFDKTPTIKELAELSGLSEYKLKEGFKQVYGSTIYGFVLDKKLEFAREKLETGDWHVKDISYQIGYENPSHFIAAFKKKYGITPKQFAKTT